MNRALLQKLRKTSAKMFPKDSGEHDGAAGVIMRITPDYRIYPGTIEAVVRPFEMFLSLTLPKDRVFAEPPKEERTKAFNAAMDYLEGCLTK
jgi:hypothetical protein